MTEDSISARGQASRTAMMTAAARGWHRYQHGRRAIHDDWLGWPLVGPEAEPLTAGLHSVFGDATFLIANWIAARSRFAEDWFEESGAQQYVVLGAGLDTFAWRVEEGVRVFEVDHPASQRWKQDRLQSLMLDAPPNLVWVGVDFERDSIGAALGHAGLDTERPVFASWLGVTPYLSRAAIAATLADLPVSDLAMSYAPPADEWSDEARVVSERFLPLAEGIGEKIIGFYRREEIEDVLAGAGFRLVDELGAPDVPARFGLEAVANGEERVVLARRGR